MCRELQSDAVPLFVATPNARGGVGSNQDCFVPSYAACVVPLNRALFAFVGKLFGLAVRGQHMLNLDLVTSTILFASAQY